MPVVETARRLRRIYQTRGFVGPRYNGIWGKVRMMRQKHLCRRERVLYCGPEPPVVSSAG